MTSPASLADLADRINVADRALAGDLLAEARARLIPQGRTVWSGWVAQYVTTRTLRDVQRLVAEAKERADDNRRKSLVCPVDLILAEQGATVVEASPPALEDVAEVSPLEHVAEPVVAGRADAELVDEPALTGDVVTDLAEAIPAAADAATGEEDPAPVVDIPEPDPPIVDEQDVAEFDVVYTEVAEPPATAPEPSPIPHGAERIAALWLSLSPRVQQEVVRWTEGRCVETGYFIAYPEAVAVARDVRTEIYCYATPEVRALFARWARSLPGRAA